MKVIAVSCFYCFSTGTIVALNETSSLKLITDILSEEGKSMKKTTQMGSNTDNSWSTVKGSNLCASMASIQPKSSSHGASNCIQYAVLLFFQTTNKSMMQHSPQIWNNNRNILLELISVTPRNTTASSPLQNLETKNLHLII